MFVTIIDHLYYERFKTFFFVLFLQITRQMKKSLSTLGYTEQDVNQMSPSEAHDVVNRGVKKTAKLHPGSKD